LLFVLLNALEAWQKEREDSAVMYGMLCAAQRKPTVVPLDDAG